MSAVSRLMRTSQEIHEEIERLSEQRSELWHELSIAYDPEIRQRIRTLDAALDERRVAHPATASVPATRLATSGAPTPSPCAPASAPATATGSSPAPGSKSAPSACDD